MTRRKLRSTSWNRIISTKLHRYQLVLLYSSSTKCPILSSDFFSMLASSRTCKFFTFHSFLPRPPKYSFQFVCTKVCAADENYNSSCHHALNLSLLSIYTYCIYLDSPKIIIVDKKEGKIDLHAKCFKSSFLFFISYLDSGR